MDITTTTDVCGQRRAHRTCTCRAASPPIACASTATIKRARSRGIDARTRSTTCRSTVMSDLHRRLFQEEDGHRFLLRARRYRPLPPGPTSSVQRKGEGAVFRAIPPTKIVTAGRARHAADLEGDFARRERGPGAVHRPEPARENRRPLGRPMVDYINENWGLATSSTVEDPDRGRAFSEEGADQTQRGSRPRTPTSFAAALAQLRCVRIRTSILVRRECRDLRDHLARPS